MNSQRGRRRVASTWLSLYWAVTVLLGLAGVMWWWVWASAVAWAMLCTLVALALAAAF